MRILLIFLAFLPNAQAQELSYEARQVGRALQALALEPDLAPDGKVVEHIHIARSEVFVEDEPFPTFPNHLHWLTVEETVRREVLLAPGQPWDAAKAMETARNLRDLRIFSVVAVVPVRTADPEKVSVLVVTRDLWSLRLEWNLQFNDDQIDQLLVQLTERNLFGRNKRVLGRVLVLPLTWSLGEAYVDRRLVGENFQLEQSFDAYFRREDNDFDGFTTRVELSRPFYDLQQGYGFRLTAQIQDRVFRQYQGGEIITYDDPDTVEEEAIRRVFEAEAVQVSALARHQFAGAFTQRLAWGLGASRLGVGALAESRIPAGYRGDGFERDVLPRALTQVYPVVAWSGFSNDFKTFQDLASFGQSEDERLGPDLAVSVSVPLEVLGSTADAVLTSGSAAYAHGFGGDGLAEVAVGASVRFEDGDFIDRELVLRGRFATPRAPFGRIVTRGDWLLNAEHSRNAPITLGGHNGLRGYPSEFFLAFGGDRVRANAEYRTPPFVWHYLHLGAVAFYDAGDLYDCADGCRDGGRTFTWHHAIGGGLRILFPQFNREVFRLDLGFPLEDAGFALMGTFTISGGTGQAVPLTSREDLQYDHVVGSLYNQP